MERQFENLLYTMCNTRLFTYPILHNLRDGYFYPHFINERNQTQKIKQFSKMYRAGKKQNLLSQCFSKDGAQISIGLQRDQAKSENKGTKTFRSI